MPGPAPKPADRRQWRGRADIGLVEPAAHVDAPAAPKGVLASTRTSWAAFWASPVSATVDRQSDMPALVRLFGFYDDAERSARSFKKRMFVEGSQKQPVLNPAGDRVLKLEPLIRGLEDRFGLSPMARLKLGITFGDAARSLEELNSLGFADDASDDVDELDPRVIDIA